MNIINYFIYRVNTGYDNFLPSKIPQRTINGTFYYNWGCYLEALDRGDTILTYFTGSGCRKGIYAITIIKNFDITKNEANVEAQIIECSSDNWDPLIPHSGNEEYFSDVISRKRGAEIVIPNDYDYDTYNLLCDSIKGFREKIEKKKIYFPGEKRLRLIPIATIPQIDLGEDLSDIRKRDNPISSFWIRPSQSSWIKNPPNWLYFISQMFYNFKKGYVNRLPDFAKSLAVQIRGKYNNSFSQIGAIIGVPLNERKKSAGEVDRVKKLGDALSFETGLPYLDSISLRGDISRRKYKLCSYSVLDFQKEYYDNLKIRNTNKINSLCESKILLLLDDVFTDGVTTKTVKQKILDECSIEDGNIQCVTLGMMSKVRNMSTDLSNSWR